MPERRPEDEGSHDGVAGNFADPCKTGENRANHRLRWNSPVSSPIEPSRSDIYKPLSADEQGVFSPIGEAESGYQGGAGEGTEPRARMPADRRPRPVSAALPDPPLAAASGGPEFETTAQGSRVATSVGGVPTGSGADIIVIGHPLKREIALSQTQRQAANEWFDHDLYSGLNEQLTGAIILIMHRPHESLHSA
jgi:hypothetical protein